MTEPGPDDRASMSLDSKSAPNLRTAGKGGTVALFGQGTKLVLQLTSTAILARLLTPEDFGVMSLAIPLIAFLTVFRDFGLTSATIYSEDITAREVSSLFYINVVVGVVLAALLLVASPFAAILFNDKRLATVLAVLALVFILNGIGSQYQALLQRGFRFVALTWIDVGSTALGTLSGLIAAWLGFGYWALVVIPVATQTSSLIATISCSTWHPGAPTWEKRTGSMTRFGSEIAGFNLLNYLSRNVDNLLIGKFWGLESLGFYGRAYSLMMAPLTQIIYPLTQVVVPVLSRLAGNNDEYRRTYLTILSLATFVCTPLVVWLLVCREWIVGIMLGPQWDAAVPIFLALGFSALVQPVNNSAGWLMMSQGRSRDVLKWGLLGGILTVISIVAGLPWGALGVAAAYSAFQIAIVTPVLWWFACARGPVHMRDLSLASFPIWTAAAIAGLSAELIKTTWPAIPARLSPMLNLTIALVWIACVYIGLLSTHSRGRALLKQSWRRLLQGKVFR